VLAAGCLAAACRPAAKPPIEPALPPASITLEPDVRALVDRQVEVVRQHPSDSKEHGRLGLMYEANDLWVAAEASYAAAATLDPSEALWRYHRSVVLREVGRVDEANQLLVEAAKELPREPGVQHRLGTVLLDLGDLPGAEAAFQRALGRAPDNPPCLVGLAFVHTARSEWEQARDLAARVLSRDSSFKQAHYALGLAYRGLGDPNRSAAELALGSEAKPRYIDDALSPELKRYRVNLMSQITETAILEQAGRFEEALAIWARIADRHPDNKNMATNYGAALLNLGRVDEAIVQLKKSLALDDDQFAAHLNLAEAYLQAGRLQDAQKHADRAVSLGPLVAGTYRTRAHVLAGGKRYEDAYQDLRRAVKIDPHDAVAFGALAEISLLSGHSDEALGWCRNSLDLDPSNLVVRVNLARLTLNSGDSEGARIQVKELLKLAPDNPRVQSIAQSVGLAPP
jgi:tetratricopeptide (TPR) repeat protein